METPILLVSQSNAMSLDKVQRMGPKAQLLQRGRPSYWRLQGFNMGAVQHQILLACYVV